LKIDDSAAQSFWSNWSASSTVSTFETANDIHLF